MSDEQKVHTGQRFQGVRVDLTGANYLDCTFSGCAVEMWDRLECFTRIEGCSFEGCTYAGDGWPKPVIEFVLDAKNTSGEAMALPDYDKRN